MADGNRAAGRAAATWVYSLRAEEQVPPELVEGTADVGGAVADDVGVIVAATAMEEALWARHLCFFSTGGAISGVGGSCCGGG